MTINSDPKVHKSEEEWRELLTPEQFHVLRKHGTERAGSSSLNDEHREGTFICAACDNLLFKTNAKFESGTGWPSFFQPYSANAITEHKDRSFFMTRIEVRCANCDGHLGHVFKDGPQPTGLRYCMNGVAMNFTPDEND